MQKRSAVTGETEERVDRLQLYEVCYYGLVVGSAELMVGVKQRLVVPLCVRPGKGLHSRVSATTSSRALKIGNGNASVGSHTLITSRGSRVCYFTAGFASANVGANKNTHACRARLSLSCLLCSTPRWVVVLEFFFRCMWSISLNTDVIETQELRS